MDVKSQLQQLFYSYESDAASYPWKHESDRFVELIFCLLNQVGQNDADAARTAVDSLHYLGLLELEKMAALETQGAVEPLIVVYVLQQHGFSESEAQHAIRLFAEVANVVKQQFEGKIQNYLRRKGHQMRDELVSTFGSVSLAEDSIRYAISHWLQNALSVPISLENQSTIEFCRENGVSLQGLLDAADEANLSVALVDDLLELDRQIKQVDSQEVVVAEREL